MAQRDYSLLDRLAHRMAFIHRAVQLSAADVEAALYGRRYRGIVLGDPVFITSLPRAGTTLLLELLSGLPDFATHCYRDMPFVLAPVLWDVWSRGFRRPTVPREREHGDGVMVGYDSPEAFEEVLWMAHWPHRYRGDQVPLWESEEDHGPFRQTFSDHMRKVIAARSGQGTGRNRYLSKNNANIGRLGFLRRSYPRGKLLVPFRDPLAQAASLRRQHLRFSEIQGREPFSRRYMGDIGHFEFGDLHRPISFPGIESLLDGPGPENLGYWVHYWVLAFTHVLRHEKDVLLVSYEDLCRGGSAGLRTLGRVLGISEESLEGEDAYLRPPAKHDEDIADIDQPRLETARRLHDRLLEHSVTRRDAPGSP